MSCTGLSFTLGLAQTGFPTDGNVVAQVRALAERAQQEGVSLLVFPENLMCPRELSANELASIAETLDGSFVREASSIASVHNLWIVFTMSEKNPLGGPPFNTAVVVDDCGETRGAYRKCHLYDAHGVRESDRMTAGDEICRPVRAPFCTFGVGICYDLRFPEVARALALAGCDLLLFSAAWHDGPNKLLHWKTLLRARAIENECYVAGICHGAARYVRQSFVFDPLGNDVACASITMDSGDLLTCTIDPAAMASARDAMPVFSHRKPSLYSSLST